jgi:hypothetical protein
MCAQAGADITILARVNNDWLFGQLYDSKGSFPAAYVDRIPDDLPKHKSEEMDNKTNEEKVEKQEEHQVWE